MPAARARPQTSSPELVARVLLDRLLHPVPELVVRLLRPGRADDREALGQHPPERASRAPASASACARSPEAPKMTSTHGSGRRRSWSSRAAGWLNGRESHASLRRLQPSAPRASPNWFRSAAFTLAANDSSWRDAKRANSAALITGTGTFSAIASAIVQRPSPESSTPPPDLLELAAFGLEGGVEQLEQPGADDRAVAPDAGDLVQVEGGTPISPAPRSPPHTPASGRTRSRCTIFIDIPAPDGPTCA